MKNLLSYLFLCCLHLQDVATLDTLSQWVSNVTRYSTQYSAIALSANQIIGQPNVFPAYGYNNNAWSPTTQQSNSEFIQFDITTPVCVTSITTYETRNAGFVVQILALNSFGAWDELWSGTPTWIQTSRNFSPPLRRVSYTTKTFLIIMNGSMAVGMAGNNYIALDAVSVDGSLSCTGVVTLDTSSQWVANVTSYSTQNSATALSANQIIGQPNVFPAYGYNDNAWSPTTQQSSSEFIQFEISTPVCVTSITTYETRNAGFVVQILALNSFGAWDELWSGTATWIQTSRIFSPPLRRVSYATKSFRINMSGSMAAGALGNNYIALDAVSVDGSLSCAASLIPLDDSVRLNAAKLVDKNATTCVSGIDSAMLRYRLSQMSLIQMSVNMTFNVTLTGSNLSCSPSTSLGYYLFAVSRQLTSGSGTAVYGDEQNCKLSFETPLTCRFECKCQSSSCGMITLWYVGCGSPAGMVCEVLL